MSYHPIMGIMIFILFLVLAFMLGKKTNKKKYKEIKIKKNINLKTDSISPDANWIE